MLRTSKEAQRLSTLFPNRVVGSCFGIGRVCLPPLPDSCFAASSERTFVFPIPIRNVRGRHPVANSARGECESRGMEIGHRAVSGGSGAVNRISASRIANRLGNQPGRFARANGSRMEGGG